jgi:hypothetical protein
MLAVQAIVFFGPPPSSDHSIAMTALFSYCLFAALAFWLEKKRIPNGAVATANPSAPARFASESGDPARSLR